MLEEVEAEGVGDWKGEGGRVVRGERKVYRRVGKRRMEEEGVEASDGRRSRRGGKD